MPVLRPIDAADAATIREWPPYPGDMAQMDYALRQHGWLEEFHQKPSASVYAVVEGDDLVGFTILAETGDAEGEFRIALRPDKAGQGLGEGITVETLRIGFVEQRLSRIYLIVRKNNYRGIRLYERVGFVLLGECSKEIQGVSVAFLKMAIDREQFSASMERGRKNEESADRDRCAE